MSRIILAVFLVVVSMGGRATAAEFVDYGTQHQIVVPMLGVPKPLSLHICANNAFMIGAHVKANQFACEDTFPIPEGLFWGGPTELLFRYGGPAAIISNEPIDRAPEGRYQSHGMAACPPGTAMVGLHHAENVLACAPLPQFSSPTTVEFWVDPHTYRPLGTVNMHVCPKGWFMVGIHEARDLLLCGRIKRK